jgi:transcriptional regulator with XRE-family HTH domain
VIIPTKVDEAAKWLKSERSRRGWSTIVTASRAKLLAEERGDAIKLTQQSISLFEKGQSKRVPHWLLYISDAFDQFDKGIKASDSTTDFDNLECVELQKLPAYELLKRLHAEFGEFRKGMSMAKLRMGSIEQHVAALTTDVARINVELDGINTRLGRIDVRLGLVDA